jgi:hypothetical protein
MALMVLVRLPTETELDAAGVEPHTFLDAFNKHAVSPFAAKVKKSGDYAVLDKWNIRKADWFRLVEG